MGGLLAFPKSGQLTYVPLSIFPSLSHLFVAYQGNFFPGNSLLMAPQMRRVWEGCMYNDSNIARRCSDRGAFLLRAADSLRAELRLVGGMVVFMRATGE